MFSPGEWHKQVPRNLRDNLRFRRFVIQQSSKDARLRKDLIRVCREDLLFYINTFVFQYNPRVNGREIGPFITWPAQEDAVRKILSCIERQRDLAVEKSREMGASWLFLIVMDWFIKFHDGKKFLCVSRNADAVDKPGDSDSLFWKLDFISRYQPKWLFPQIDRSKFVITCGTSSITGQASTGKAGVGGRCTAMFVDEFSQIAEDFQILGRTADTTGCRIFNFTHIGMQTAAYQISQRVDMEKVVLHWSMHPDKGKGAYHYDQETNRVVVHDKSYQYPEEFRFVMDGSPTGGPYPGLRSPWYDAECIRRASARDVAMDLDINPQGSTSQFFSAIEIRKLQRHSQEPLWTGNLDYDKEKGIPRGLVTDRSGRIKMWILPVGNGHAPVSLYGAGCDISAGTGATPSCLSIIDASSRSKVLEYADANIDPGDFANFVVALCRLFRSMDNIPAKLTWEHAGGVGSLFGKRVLALGYQNIMFRTVEDGIAISTATRPGFMPTDASKRVLLEEYRQAIQTGKLLNPSRQALEDCLSFAYGPRGEVEATRKATNNDPSGGGINHADLVIADALAWKMAVQVSSGLANFVDAKEDVKIGSLAWRHQLAAEADYRRRLYEEWV